MITILIATDFSTEAENAVHYAMQTSQEIKARVLLFHLHTVSVHAVNARLPAGILQETLDMHKRKLTAKAEDLCRKYDLEVLPIWATGNFYEELQKTIVDYDVRLVAMGMAEKSFEQDLLGNTTTASISRINKPILAIPHKVEYKKVEKILFACDANKGLFSSDLDILRIVSQVLQAEIKVFYIQRSAHAPEKKEILRNLLNERFIDIPFIFEVKESNDPILPQIQQELIDYKADLLVMVPYKYGFLNSIIHKSKTRAMASRSQIPLLTIPYLVKGKV